MRTLRQSLLAVLLAAIAGLAGCSGADCDAPSTPQYSTSPVDSSTAGCSGYAPDTAKRYPVGTVVRLPQCLDAYPGSVATCTCYADGSGGAPQWGCPI